MRVETPMVDSGALRHRVTHQSLTTTDGLAGDQLETWNPVQTYWSLVEDLEGRELFYAAQLEIQVSHKVTLRYFPSMTPISDRDRFLWGDRVLNVQGQTNPGNRNVMLYFLCLEDSSEDPPIDSNGSSN